MSKRALFERKSKGRETLFYRSWLGAVEPFDDPSISLR
jgi:hypothetical protein